MKIEINEHENQKVLIIDGELFDWGLDEEALMQANEFASNPNALKAIHSDIKKYFLECLEEFLGFKTNIKKVNEAIKKGYIEND